MRIEGRKKLGYYPTPDRVVNLIKTYLKFPQGSFVALDPCCGKGFALRDIIEGTEGKGYGIEINDLFIPEAKDNLFKVARGGYEMARVSNNAFSILCLNPPYGAPRSGKSTL